MLRLNHIGKIFNEGTVDEKVALQRTDLDLLPGDFVTVIGSNGAGKSTLLNTIAGVFLPDEGRIEVDGRDVTRWPEYRRSPLIGRVFQDPMAGTAPSMTIEENLSMAYCRDKSRGLRLGVNKKRRAWFREWLMTLNLGLEDRLTAKVGLLSGGERQALSLLMATFTEPKILLLDEHTAALDPSRARRVIEMTTRLVKKANLTTLMVTHNMNQALELGNRLIMMDKGTIILDVRDEEKESLTMDRLLKEFENRRGEAFANDRMLL